MPGLLIHNPGAGSHDAELLESIAQALGDVKVIEFDAIDDMARVADEARQRGCTWVAVAGGDGTIEAVAAGLVHTDMPLGVIPFGTYNNFARSLDIPIDPLEACEIINAGNMRAADAAEAGGHLFFECAGAGLDAALFPLGEEIKSGGFAKWIDFFRLANRYPLQRFTLKFDRPVCEALSSRTANFSKSLRRLLSRIREQDVTLSALMVTVSNGPYYGMNFAVAPEARMNDGLLTVTVFHRYSKLQLWWHFLSIAFGGHEYSPKSVTFRVSKVDISGPKKVAVHLDGTAQEIWPLSAACKPAALKVFLPA